MEARGRAHPTKPIFRPSKAQMGIQRQLERIQSTEFSSLAIKVQGRKPKSVEKKSNTWVFICPMDNVNWASGESRLSVQSWLPPSDCRFKNFSGPQLSVESGYTTSPFWQSPFIRPQRGENKNLCCGNECNKRPLKKLSRPAPMRPA